jgi:hypothetical protein
MACPTVDGSLRYEDVRERWLRCVGRDPDSDPVLGCPRPTLARAENLRNASAARNRSVPASIPDNLGDAKKLLRLGKHSRCWWTFSHATGTVAGKPSRSVLAAGSPCRPPGVPWFRNAQHTAGSRCLAPAGLRQPQVFAGHQTTSHVQEAPASGTATARGEGKALQGRR